MIPWCSRTKVTVWQVAADTICCTLNLLCRSIHECHLYHVYLLSTWTVALVSHTEVLTHLAVVIAACYLFLNSGAAPASTCKHVSLIFLLSYFPLMYFSQRNEDKRWLCKMTRLVPMAYLAGPPQELLPSYRNKWLSLVEVVLIKRMACPLKASPADAVLLPVSSRGMPSQDGSWYYDLRGLFRVA